MAETTIDKMIEEQKTTFNSLDYNNKKNFLGVVVDKSREVQSPSGKSKVCDSCSYELCLLCETTEARSKEYFDQMTGEGMSSNFKL